MGGQGDVLALLPDRIAFLGFGLIGASIASALRAARCRAELVAWTPDGRGPRDGVALGLLDRRADDAATALDGAGLVVLAAPPLAVLDLLDQLAGPLRSRLAPVATVTDVASTKRRIVERAAEHRLRFVGGHPMAGREVTGVAGSTAELFVHRPWVVVPATASTAEDVARVEALAVATGARPVRMDAAVHDGAVASISHLPLVVAAALVQSVAGAAGWGAARDLAATGWSDMTRLAKGSPEMGAGILATNADAVAERLRAFRDAIDSWIAVLEQQRDSPGAPGGELRRGLEEARALLTSDAAADA